MSDSFNCSLDNRGFQALLSALSKRLFYGEQFSNDFIAEQLYNGTISEDVESQIFNFEQILRHAAEGNWDPSRLETCLNRSSTINSQHSRILIVFWTNERDKIHSKLVRESCWNSKFNSMAWRVDMKTMSRDVQEINEPIALFELNTQSSGSPTKSVQFEMNRQQLGEILRTFESIQRKFDETSY